MRAVWPFLQRPRGDAGGKKRARARALAVGVEHFFVSYVGASVLSAWGVGTDRVGSAWARWEALGVLY